MFPRVQSKLSILDFIRGDTPEQQLGFVVALGSWDYALLDNTPGIMIVDRNVPVGTRPVASPY